MDSTFFNIAVQPNNSAAIGEVRAQIRREQQREQAVINLEIERKDIIPPPDTSINPYSGVLHGLGPGLTQSREQLIADIATHNAYDLANPGYGTDANGNRFGIWPTAAETPDWIYYLMGAAAFY